MVDFNMKVPSVGPRNANIMLVGEGPGKDELREGTPFVGPAGRKLNSLLKRCGIPREEIFITNCCKYYPKGRKDEKLAFYFNDPKNHSNPTDVFLEGIAELIEDIHEIKPNIVVGLGNYALWALTQNWGISSYHGSVLETTLVHGQKCLSTYHPATFLYGASAFEPQVKWDLDKAKRESEYPDIRYPAREFIILPRLQDIETAVQLEDVQYTLNHYAEILCSAESFTCDTEWYDPEHPSCFGFTVSPDWALVVPAELPGATEFLQRVLASDAKKVFQNAMFDVSYLERAGVHTKTVADDGTRLIDDTMVEHHVCWPDILNRLENLTAIYTDEPHYKDDYKVWKGTGNMDTLYTYNGKDVAVTEEIHEKLQKEKARWGTNKAYELNMLTFDIMSRATVKGIRADRAKLFEIRNRNKSQAKELLEMLSATVGWDVNPRSSPQVKKLVYNQLGLRRRTKKPTAQETLMDIAAQEADPVAKTILMTIITIRRLLNQNSRYATPSLIDTDGRIRCSWNMAGTKNGRLSSSKDKFKHRGQALQTIPYEVRKVFVPDPGCIFIVPDLEQAEARFVAYDAGDYTTIDWMEEGLDIHRKLGEILFGRPYEEIVKGSRERYLAKKCRHALNYGMGRDTFKFSVNKELIDTGFGITQKEAERLRDQYLTIHGALELWWKDIQQQLSRNGYLVNPLGRRRNFLGSWGAKLFMDAYAFKPQSTIADLTHIGLHRIDQELEYADVLINMHDGSLIQVPEDKVEEAIPKIKELLSIPITVQDIELVIPVEVKVGYSWGEVGKPKDVLHT